MVEILPELIAVSIALIAAIAEFVHWRRIRHVARLAFGPKERPALWVYLTPVLRVLGLSIASWGFLSLFLVVEAQVHNTGEIKENEYKHLVLVVDVSPSMALEDAGPEGDRTRRQRASDVLASLFNRIPMRQFKVTVIAVYTDAKLLLQDSKDHEVVRHIMEEMPMWHAFKPGKTKLMDGITEAAKIVKPWNPGSTYVVMLTDGDTVPTTGMPKLPASVADFIIVGVGNSNTGTFIDGHQSRQDTNTLRQIANRLRGTYHDGDKKHLTSQIVGKFTRTDDDDPNRKWTRREWALLAILAGSFVYAILPVLLHYFGTNYRAGTRIGKNWEPMRKAG